MSDLEKIQYQTERIAPEGGFGYLVAIGMALPIACALGSLSSFGLMFNDFITNLGGATSSVTIIIGTFFSALSFAGLFTNTLFKKFSVRSIGIFGSSIYFLGNFMMVFATSVEHLIVSFGVLQGAGFGFMMPVAFTTFNNYFVTKRVFMMSVAQALIGIGIMGYPLLVNCLMQAFGFRGAMAMIAAISGHTIWGMLVMHPIKWHYKVIQTRVFEIKPLMDENKANKMSDDEFELSQLPACVMKKSRLSVSSPESDKNNFIENTDDAILLKLERSKSLDPTQYADFVTLKQRMPSVMSLGDWNGTAVLSENCKPSKTKKWQKVVDFLDLTLLKDWTYVNIVLGISFALYSDNSFFTLQPLYLFELKFTQTEAAMIVAAGAAADLCSRVFLAIVSFFVQIKARYIYLTGAIATIIFRFVFINIHDFIGMFVITCVMGFFRTFVHVPLALVFGEHLPPERFASGYGLFMFLQGNFAFLIGPFIGWIRDVTQSFIICFHSLTFIMSLCAIPWIIEIVWLRMHPKTNQNKSRPSIQ